jgi:hypothetical protein
MISRRSEWLLTFLAALRTAVYLDCFHTKAQSPPARSSASTVRVKKKKESCWWRQDGSRGAVIGVTNLTRTIDVLEVWGRRVIFVVRRVKGLKK